MTLTIVLTRIVTLLFSLHHKGKLYDVTNLQHKMIVYVIISAAFRIEPKL